MKEFIIYAPATELLETGIDEIAEEVPSFIATGVIKDGFLTATAFCDEKDAGYVERLLTAVVFLS